MSTFRALTRLIFSGFLIFFSLGAEKSCDFFQGTIVGECNCVTFTTTKPFDKSAGPKKPDPSKTTVTTTTPNPDPCTIYDDTVGSWSISSPSFPQVETISGTGPLNAAKTALYAYVYVDHWAKYAECTFCPLNGETTKIEDGKVVDRNADGKVISTRKLASASDISGDERVSERALTVNGKLALGSAWESDKFTVGDPMGEIRLLINVGDQGQITGAMAMSKYPAINIPITLTNIEIYPKSKRSHFVTSFGKDQKAPVDRFELSVWIVEGPNKRYPMEVTVTKDAQAKPTIQKTTLVQIK